MGRPQTLHVLSPASCLAILSRQPLRRRPDSRLRPESRAARTPGTPPGADPLLPPSSLFPLEEMEQLVGVHHHHDSLSPWAPRTLTRPQPQPHPLLHHLLHQCDLDATSPQPPSSP